MAASLGLLVSGCASTYEPQNLHTPTTVTCIDLPTAVSSIQNGGLLNVEFELRLERGPYISVKEDQEGTYYEGSPGTVSHARVDGKDFSIKGDHLTTFDGGFWIPRDPNAMPRLFTYSNDLFHHARTNVPPAAASCATSRYTRDATTGGLKLVLPAANVSPADPDLAAFKIAPDSRATIYPGAPLSDPKFAMFAAKIKELAGHAVVLSQVPASGNAVPPNTSR